jgi:oxygen-independent coproporphyrinogen-3 oxidase
LWLKRVDAQGHGTQGEDELSPETRAEELVMVGLRLIEGLDKARFARIAGRPLTEVIDTTAAKNMIAEGFLRESSTTLSATPKGRLALNAVLREILS